MKRKILFNLTVGSHWPHTDSPLERSLPQGGTPVDKIIEFETNGVDPFKDACDALTKELEGKSYHIWYWTFYTDGEG